MKDLVQITHGSLFTGIGGFDLAAAACGWRNLFYCETDSFCRHILKFHFPKSYGYGDIKEADFERFGGKIDVLSGGFPCQPYSLAGKQLGKEDPRHLWPYMRSAIHIIHPAWVVAENVYGIVTWQEGMVFEEVHAQLEAEGYEVGAFILPAAGINAPHRRYRVFFIAHQNTDSNGRQSNIRQKRSKNREFRDACTGIDERLQSYVEQIGAFAYTDDSGEYSEYRTVRKKDAKISQRNDRSQFSHAGLSVIPYTKQEGFKRRAAKRGSASSNTNGFQRCKGRLHQKRSGKTEKHAGTYDARFLWKDWEDFPAEPPLRGRDDGLSKILDARPVSEETQIGSRPLTSSKWESESLKGYGNAVVPQLAYVIFDSINQIITDHEH